MAATVSRPELLSRLDVPLARKGVAAAVVVGELAAAVDSGLTGSVTGRFFAWVDDRPLLRVLEQPAMLNVNVRPAIHGSRRQGG